MQFRGSVRSLVAFTKSQKWYNQSCFITSPFHCLPCQRLYSYRYISAVLVKYTINVQCNMRNNAYLAHEVLVIRNVKLSNQSLDGADVQLTLQQQSTVFASSLFVY